MAKPTMNNVQTDLVYMYNIVDELVVVKMPYKAYRRQLYHERNRRVRKYVYRHRVHLLKDPVLWKHRIRIYKRVYKYCALIPQHEKTYSTAETCRNPAVLHTVQTQLTRDVLTKMMSISEIEGSKSDFMSWYTKHSNDEDDRICRRGTEYAFSRLELRHMSVTSHDPVVECLVQQDDESPPLQIIKLILSDWCAYRMRSIEKGIWYETAFLERYCNEEGNILYDIPTYYQNRYIAYLLDSTVGHHSEIFGDDDLEQQCETVCFNPKTDRKKKIKTDKEKKKLEKHRLEKKRPPWFRPKMRDLEEQDDGDDDYYLTGSIVRCNTDSDDDSVPLRPVPPDEIPNVPGFEETEYDQEQYRQKMYNDCYDRSFESMNIDGITAFLMKLKYTTIQGNTIKFNLTRAQLMPKISIDQHALIKMTENCLTLWIALRSSRTWVQFTQILVMYMCVSSDESMSLLLTNYILSLFDNELEPQDEGEKSQYEITYVLRNLLKVWKDVRHSYLINSIKKTFAIMIMFGVLEKEKVPFCIDKFEHVFKCADTKEFQKLDAIEWLLDFSAFMIEKGIAICKGDSLMTFFYHDSAAMKLQEDYAFLITNYSLYENGQLNKINIDESEFRNRLFRCLTTMKRLASHTHKGPELNVLQQKLIKLMEINVKIIEKDNNDTLREAPYAVLLFGDSGVGKSAFLPVIQNFLLRTNGFDPSKEGITSMNPSEKYQSDLETKHICVTFDDSGNTKATKAEGNHCDLFIKFVNNNMVHAIKADLSQKGQVLIKPKIVLTTTNIKSLDAEQYSNHVSSVLRRFVSHITMKVREPYRMTNSTMLDPSKMIEPVEDAWLFTVEEVVPTQEIGGRASYIHVLHRHDFGNGLEPLADIGIVKLLKFLAWQSKNHFEHQKRLLKNVDIVHETALCQHGIYSTVCTECLEPQDDDTEVKWRKFVNIPRIWHALSSYTWFIMPVEGPLTKVLKKADNVISLPQRCVFAAAWESLAIALFFSFFTPLHTLVVILTYFVSLILVSVAHMRSEIITSAKECRDIPFSAMKKTYKCVSTVSKILAGLTMLFVVKTVYDIFVGKPDDTEPQGSIPVIPKKDDELFETKMWKKPYIIPVDVDAKVDTMTHEQLSTVVSGVLARAEFFNPGEPSYKVNIFPIGNNLWLAPWHTITKKCTRVRVSYHGGELVGPNFTANIDLSIAQRIGNTDLGLILLNKGGDRKDMLPFFPKTLTASRTPATLLYRDKDYSIIKDHIAANYRPMDKDDFTFHGVEYNLSFQTYRGLCMATLVAESKKPYILGFHLYGKADSTYGVAQQVLKCELEAARSALYASSNLSFKIHHSKSIDFDIPERGIFVNKEVHDKSPANFLPDESTVNFIGTHTGTRRHWKSNVAPTPISDLVEQHLGVKAMHGKPHIKGWAPWQSELEKISNTCELELPMLNKAYTDFMSDIDAFIAADPTCLDHIHPLHIDANLAGVDGVNVINAIDRSTSMGWPHNTPKKHFIIPKDEIIEGITCPMMMTPELEHEVNTAKAELANGHRCNFIGRATLKDEPTKIAKTKVRVFVASPCALIIIMREYFLTISKFIQEHAELFECAVGTNAYGKDWSDIARRITKFGKKRCLAGDFESFDSRMAAMLVLLAFKLMIHIATLAGFSEEQIVIMHGIATEIAYYFAEFNGEFYKACGSNPSGHSLTVIINDLINSIYMRYVFYHVFNGAPPGTFKEHVSLVTYGDDNVMSVSDTVAEQFNHTAIARVLGYSGINYTMADKTSESVPFIPFDQCTFLKRSFVWSEKYQNWLGPIEEASIFKSLHAVLRSKVLTPEQQCDEVVHNACREYFYYGEDAYNMRSGQLQKVVDDSGFSHVFRDIPTFIELEAEYIEKYC